MRVWLCVGSEGGSQGTTEDPAGILPPTMAEWTVIMEFLWKFKDLRSAVFLRLDGFQALRKMVRSWGS